MQKLLILFALLINVQAFAQEINDVEIHFIDRQLMLKAQASEFRERSYMNMLDAQDLVEKIQSAQMYFLSFDFQLVDRSEAISEAEVEALEEISVKIASLGKNKNDKIAIALALHELNSLQRENREKLKLPTQSMLDLIVKGLIQAKENSNLTSLARVAARNNNELKDILKVRYEALAKFAMSDKFSGDYGHEEALRLVKQAIELKGYLRSLEIEAKLSPSFINSLKHLKFIPSRYHSHQDVRELILKELSND